MALHLLEMLVFTKVKQGEFETTIFGHKLVVMWLVIIFLAVDLGILLIAISELSSD